MTGVMLTLLLAALDQTIVGTAMPRIIAQLNGFDRYAWVTTAYLLTSTAAVPIFGKLSDIYGRKWFYLGGAVLFVVASALCGAAGSIPGVPGGGMTQLIVFRGLQGVGGGIIMAITFTIIGDIFPPAVRGKYQGLLSAVWGMSSVFGPTLGGWITDSFSWRWIFYINLPVGILATVALFVAFPYFKPEGVKRVIDYRRGRHPARWPRAAPARPDMGDGLRLGLAARHRAARRRGRHARRLRPRGDARRRTAPAALALPRPDHRPLNRSPSSSTGWRCSLRSSSSRSSCRR